jgi:uncharacterized protein YneF (UPF0154 family)
VKTFLYIVGVLLILTGLAGIILGGWYVGRAINYKLGYKSMVQETVREMVKPEALRAK